MNNSTNNQNESVDSLIRDAMDDMDTAIIAAIGEESDIMDEWLVLRAKIMAVIG